MEVRSRRDPPPASVVQVGGLGPFDNDAAVDWFIELEEDEQADLEELRAALRGVHENVRKAYAAATIVAASRGTVSGELDSAVSDWIEILPNHPDDSDIDLALSALDALERAYVGRDVAPESRMRWC